MRFDPFVCEYGACEGCFLPPIIGGEGGLLHQVCCECGFDLYKVDY